MNPFAQVIDIVISLYITIILLRFFLQYFRADFYNPLSQFTVKATDFFVKPLRRIIPGFGGLDLSSLVLAYVVILIKPIILYSLAGEFNFNFVSLGLYSIVELIQSILRLFMMLIFIRVLLSWISPGGFNPMTAVISQISEPVISKFRKILPQTSGFDLAPMVALLLIYFLQSSLSYYIVPLI